MKVATAGEPVCGLVAEVTYIGEGSSRSIPVSTCAHLGLILDCTNRIY